VGLTSNFVSNCQTQYSKAIKIRVEKSFLEAFDTKRVSEIYDSGHVTA